MPRPRYRLRTLLIAVAVASLVLAAGDHVRRRREAFQRRVAVCAQEARREYLLGMYAGQLPFFASAGLTPMQERTRDAHYEQADYFSDLEAKYRRAAGRPWLPVGADPPRPVWPRGVPVAQPGRVTARK